MFEWALKLVGASVRQQFREMVVREGQIGSLEGAADLVQLVTGVRPEVPAVEMRRLTAETAVAVSAPTGGKGKGKKLATAGEVA